MNDKPKRSTLKSQDRDHWDQYHSAGLDDPAWIQRANRSTHSLGYVSDTTYSYACYNLAARGSL